jgi:Protein of unknown function (DUF3380).
MPQYLQQAADLLGLDPCLIRAVVAVESRGNPFLPDGRPVILFEGHVFWHQLRKRGIRPEKYSLPEVLHETPDRSKYKGGAAEHERLNIAALVNKDAALCSASWGMFQIMGFNYAACGFPDVAAFVKAQESESGQVDAFCRFLAFKGWGRYLAAHDWDNFALLYNGPGYRKNNYHTKLRAAFERCRESAL